MPQADAFFTWFQSLDRMRLFSTHEVELMSEAWHSRDEEFYRLEDQLEEITKDCNRNFGEVQRLREENEKLQGERDYWFYKDPENRKIVGPAQKRKR